MMPMFRIDLFLKKHALEGLPLERNEEDEELAVVVLKMFVSIFLFEVEALVVDDDDNKRDSDYQFEYDSPPSALLKTHLMPVVNLVAPIC